MKFIDNEPIFVQIAHRVEQDIASGKWSEGERIPSTRDLAIELAVNPATVIRAYERLTEQSLIESQRGLGYFVSQGAVERIRNLRRSEFLNHTISEFINAMHRVGVSVDEVIERLKQS
ncbi:MAG: GntR family transcriptional regulator, partial [Mucinivorans sp.]